MCICVYFIKWRERVFNFRYEIFFLSFFPLLYCICFLFLILRGTVFRGHPVNAFREIRFECTHSHTQCCSCVYATRLFRNTEDYGMRGNKREIEKRQLYTDSGTVVICNTCTHTYNTHAYTCKAIQAIHTKKIV